MINGYSFRRELDLKYHGVITLALYRIINDRLTRFLLKIDKDSTIDEIAISWWKLRQLHSEYKLSNDVNDSKS